MRSIIYLFIGFLLVLGTSCSAFRQAKKSKHLLLRDAYSAVWRGGVLKDEGTIYTLKVQLRKYDESLTFDCMWIGKEYMEVDARRPYAERQLEVTRGSIFNVKTVKTLKNTREEDGTVIVPLPEAFKDYEKRGKRRYTALLKYSYKGKTYYLLVTGFDEFFRSKNQDRSE